MQNLEIFEKKLNYKFKDIELLKIALTHKSSKNVKNNERLEFLGDAVIDLIVGEYLFTKFRQTNEGNLSKLRAALVNEKSLYQIAQQINLGDYIYLSTSEEHNNGRLKNSIVSDAFEAVAGAIYLESGIKVCRKVVIPLLEATFEDITMNALVKDYKTTLQEIAQLKLGVMPHYTLVSERGPDHKKEFEMAVSFEEGKIVATGIGKSKKDAEQQAAQKAINILNKAQQ